MTQFFDDMNLEEFEKATQIERNEDEMIPIEHYEKMFEEGVNCSECGQPLSHDEVIGFRTTGINKQEDMECTECFWRNVYADMKGL